MTSAEGYVWFLPGWFTRHWWDTSRYGIGYDGDSVPCTSAEMLAAVQSHFYLHTAYLGPESSTIVGNTTVSDWYNAYNERISALVSLRIKNTFYACTSGRELSHCISRVCSRAKADPHELLSLRQK
jgi:hypothetical protein